MADEMLTQLTALTPPPSGDDLIYIVNDPGGTPGSRKMTLANYLASPILIANLGVGYNQYATGFGQYRAIRDITNAQMLLLNGTAVEVAPAPGANKIIMPTAVLFWFDWTADYGNINAASVLDVEWGDSGVQPLTRLDQLFATQVSVLLASGGDTIARLQPLQGVNVVDTPDDIIGWVNDDGELASIINVGLKLFAFNSGNFNGGNAANILRVITDYTIQDLS